VDGGCIPYSLRSSPLEASMHTHRHSHTARCLFPNFDRAEAEQHFWEQIILMVVEFNHEFVANIIHASGGRDYHHLIHARANGTLYVPRDASNPTDDSFLPWPCSFLPFPPPPTCKTAKPHRARGNASRSVNPSLACLLARTAHRTVYPSSPSYSLQPLLPAVYISALRLAPRSSAIESQPAALGTEPSGVRSAGGAVINWPGRLLKF
jgi:hypothetical protein